MRGTLNHMTLALPGGATAAEYVEALRNAGVRVVAGENGTYWVGSGSRVIQRFPTFHVGAPGKPEIDHALATTGALVATYLIEPDDRRPANACLYLCRDHDYTLARLSPAMRRNVRRALRELTVSPLSAAEVLQHGAEAFCETRRRTGLDDGTAEGFRKYFAHRVNRPGECYLGAWRNDRLAAFITILHVDDWAELGCFSMDSMLVYRPNDALMYLVLSHYLADLNCQLVSYGLSSIQASSNAAGLHRFKRKVGFDPIRIHRAFTFHRSLRPFANRVTLTAAHWAVNGALHFRPSDRRLKKLGGMLACMLGATWMLDIAENDSAEDNHQRLPSGDI